MGKIFCLMGKSCSGKDTLYKKLLEEPQLGLKTIVPCTTRPIRSGETDGVEYHFYKEHDLERLELEGRIIELRSYETVHGIWKYFTADDGQLDLDSFDYLLIGTPESYKKMQDYFGPGRLVPLYLTVDDGLRLQRALDRERVQNEPRYSEMCRRFLADESDFSADKLSAAGIVQCFVNEELQKTADALTDCILQHLEQKVKRWI